jgi:RNA polymerase sigma-70 factor (ECF subfamily)
MEEAEILIDQIRSNGQAREQGVRALYKLYGRPLRNFFFTKGLNQDEAQDALQDTMIKIVQGSGGFSGSGQANAWIWQIARNCLTDAMRRGLTRKGNEITVSDPIWEKIKTENAHPDQLDPPGALDDCVQSGLSKFRRADPERAWVIELQVEGCGIEQIAATIGRSTAATKEYLSQCRKKMKPFLENCAELL